MFGYHVTGSTGTLFLYGIVVGAVAVVGLSLLLAGARRSSRGARPPGLRQSRRETAAVTQDRDQLIDQRQATRETAGAGTRLGNGDRHSAQTAVPQPAAPVRAPIRHRQARPAATAAGMRAAPELGADEKGSTR